MLEIQRYRYRYLVSEANVSVSDTDSIAHLWRVGCCCSVGDSMVPGTVWTANMSPAPFWVGLPGGIGVAGPARTWTAESGLFGLCTVPVVEGSSRESPGVPGDIRGGFVFFVSWVLLLPCVVVWVLLVR